MGSPKERFSFPYWQRAANLKERVKQVLTVCGNYPIRLTEDLKSIAEVRSCVDLLIKDDIPFVICRTDNGYDVYRAPNERSCDVTYAQAQHNFVISPKPECWVCEVYDMGRNGDSRKVTKVHKPENLEDLESLARSLNLGIEL